MATAWDDQLQTQLEQKYGSKKGSQLEKKYAHAFSPGYCADYSTDTAIADIEHIEKLSDQAPIDVYLYYSPEKSAYPLHLRLYQWQTRIPLADILPTLENLGLRAYHENPYQITFDDKTSAYISDFAVTYGQSTLDVETVKTAFREAFIRIFTGDAENDGFNKLILGASLSWREIIILRGLAKYLRQVGFRFSQHYIENALVTHAAITKNLVNLFIQLHDPAKQSSQTASSTIEAQITKALELVISLDEDRIIRRLLEVIKATLRTNYFQTTHDGNFKDNFAIKLNSREIPELPLPVPLYEVFVYSPRFEAIHLRNTKVARGGIRWSDRREDFRTEILGLMKAQKVKNAVIVPSGAKGGFVLKALPPNATREMLQREVIYCYQSFIRGLLDLTDNIKENEIIRPKHVVCLDDADPYLVVAADKGTATFSDIANGIAEEYGFWLGDAFASGGSSGYDHKKMGITARGAWESVKRHFRELDIDVTTSVITAVGIGDMSGDVFGNGMIYSKNLKLIAAFDHRHVFIDPNPDPATSYAERVRLFNLPTSSWEDYNPSLISPGGGVFKRSLKSITLTPEMQRVLAVSENSLTPTELIHAILCAPVDLLFNGGIGTYVKSSTENNADVGDRANDYCRVNGGELQCRVVGEGGNLGFTQLGRIEYALNGGLINTDFIDNSAGVDCSDHEVNLKILLDQEVHNKKLLQKNRNPLLASLTNEVADLVLHDNYAQALVMSFSAFHAKKNVGLHQEYIKELESSGILNRRVEFLPDDKKIHERKTAGEGLTRPEIAVLLAYTKIYIKQEILKSNLVDDAYLKRIVTTAFPDSIRKKYHEVMQDHRLHRDIIATQLSNRLVNQMGITFVYRLHMETGASIAEIIRAYTVASAIFGTDSLQKTIESLDFKIPMPMQYEMLYNIRHLINLASRWFLHSNHLKDDLGKLIEHYSKQITEIGPMIPTLMGGHTRKYLESLSNDFLKAGLSRDIASQIATYRAIYTALNIVDVASKHQFDLIKTAKVYFTSGERMNILWFRDQIANDSREGHWNTLARLTLRDELDISQRALTVAILNYDKDEQDTHQLIDRWMIKNKEALDRWNKILAMLYESTNLEYTTFFIAVRELVGIIARSSRLVLI